MKYAKLFEERKKSGEARALTPDFVKWESPGQMLIGELTAVKKCKSAKGKGDYNQYTIETDEGVQQFSLGVAMDKILSDKNYIGKILAIEFLGKRELQKGRRMNMFKVEDLGTFEDNQKSWEGIESHKVKNSRKKSIIIPEE